MGVTMGMSDVVKRKTICSYMEAVQLSMTGELVNPDSTNDATLVTLRRAFIEYIAEARSGDVKWAEGVERTQSYVPAFSLLKERIENTSTFLIRNAPNLEMAFQEIAIDFCGRVNAPDREQVQAGAFAYLSMWMNMVKDFMPMYRMKGNGSG